MEHTQKSRHYAGVLAKQGLTADLEDKVFLSF